MQILLPHILLQSPRCGQEPRLALALTQNPRLFFDQASRSLQEWRYGSCSDMNIFWPWTVLTLPPLYLSVFSSTKVTSPVRISTPASFNLVSLSSQSEAMMLRFRWRTLNVSTTATFTSVSCLQV